MRVWTNGSFARVWVVDTIYRYRDGALRVEEKIKKVKGALDVSADEVVAWSPKGVRLDGALDKKRRKVIDACALGEDRVAGVISEGRSGPRLVIGPPKGPFEHDLPLKGQETTRVAWPTGVWEAGAEPWSDAEKPSGVPNRGVRVHANAHGVAVAAGGTGHLFLWREGSEGLACALRAPGHEAARLDAVPTKQGMLVTLVLEGLKSSVVHFAEDGSVLGSWPEGAAEGSFPALRLDDDKALAFDHERDLLVLLSLPELSELSRESLTDPIVDAAVGPSGGAVVLADPTGLLDVTIDDETVSIDGPYLFEEAKKAAADELQDMGPKYKPARATGPAQIAFSAGKKQPKDPPWEVALAQDSTISMRLRSGAGPGQGIRVAISGAALQQGIVRPRIAKAGGGSVELVEQGGALVAVLPDVVLPQGVLWPLDPKPNKDDEKEEAAVALGATHFILELVVFGETAGNGLLTVAVTAENSSSAPLKRTRPITVLSPNAE